MDAAAPAARRGGCFCGANRFELVQDPALPGPCVCHCSACRRTTGGVAVPWLEVQAAAFRWLQEGALQTFRSSAKATRTFCGVCGTQARP